MRLQGRTAVITGGASGMGRSTVLRFLDEGASVVVADYNAATGQETLDLAAERGHAFHGGRPGLPGAGGRQAPSLSRFGR